MKPSYPLSRLSTLIGMVIGGLALVAVALFFSFRDLGEAEEQAVKSSAPSRMESQASSRSDPSTSTVLELATVSSPEQTNNETLSDHDATPVMDQAPPVGSEAPVPAVFGLLAETNFTNQPAAEGIQAIAEEFAEKVKHGGWDTTTEAYKTNWEKAAQEADDVFRARYGTELFLNLKRHAVP